MNVPQASSTLSLLGWNDRWEELSRDHRAKGWTIARVTEEHRGRYLVRGERFEIPAEVTGRLMFMAEDRAHFPAVGDWVAVTTYDDDSHAVIHEVLPRATLLVRKAVQKKLDQQIIAANVDYVFVVQSLDMSFNARRVERFTVVARESGARPVILLSKKDLCPPDERSDRIAEVTRFAADVPVMAYAIGNAEEMAAVRSFIQPGQTFCLLGASGVGKSTLINTLAGHEAMITGDVRDFDAKGRHVTSRRELVVLESGGILIDTPGVRELGLWEVSTGLQETFDDIADLASECFFADCTHTHEPDCAVKGAVDEGKLEPSRYESYLRLLREQKNLEARKTTEGMLKKKEEDKRLAKEIRRVVKRKGKR